MGHYTCFTARNKRIMDENVRKCVEERRGNPSRHPSVPFENRGVPAPALETSLKELRPSASCIFPNSILYVSAKGYLNAGLTLEMMVHKNVRFNTFIGIFLATSVKWVCVK